MVTNNSVQPNGAPTRQTLAPCNGAMAMATIMISAVSLDTGSSAPSVSGGKLSWTVLLTCEWSQVFHCDIKITRTLKNPYQLTPARRRTQACVTWQWRGRTTQQQQQQQQQQRQRWRQQLVLVREQLVRRYWPRWASMAVALGGPPGWRRMARLRKQNRQCALMYRHLARLRRTWCLNAACRGSDGAAAAAAATAAAAAATAAATATAGVGVPQVRLPCVTTRHTVARTGILSSWVSTCTPCRS